MRTSILLLALLITTHISVAQTSDTSGWWHDKVRVMHYKPYANMHFILANGKMRFNRALYGTNTGFRVEAGDLPEFAMYMPGMGGNLKFGLISGTNSKWIINADSIRGIYAPGTMAYEIRDAMLGTGYLQISILALSDAEGMTINVKFKNVPPGLEFLFGFGGATGKKFSRDGDIGADPESSFDLKPGYCKDNIYQLKNNSFSLLYGSGKVLSEEDRYGNKPGGNDIKSPVTEETNSQKRITGIVSPAFSIHEVDAAKQNSPFELFQSKGSATPAVAGSMKIINGDFYFQVQNSTANQVDIIYDDLKNNFNKAWVATHNVANRIRINTPDSFINTLGWALSLAADGIWEEPSYLHGAVAWRMRLNAWRGAYVADPLGWHVRARMHFSSYALSQVTSPESGPVIADTALHLARQLEKMGTSMFSSGYISRNPGKNTVPHHYDMNLVFIDQLLDHFKWTGDTAYVKKMWPLLKRHLAWEKRNFDVDGDGLYDAYAAIWASDALQYSGGGVTHSSAYNYRSNTDAAVLAGIIGEDPTPYQNEADKILKAMNKQLWMPSKGWYAEYKDKMGIQMLHPAAALWTIYHAIDEKAADPFQAYQSLRYIDNNIPHIPVRAIGLDRNDLYVLSTTNWQPYEWSLNNVVLAESQHTALAYWQGHRYEEAYRIWESSLIESMYLGASPGGFQQLSYYDAIRGELYRDFADGIGITARVLVEGLFGVNPDAMHNTLNIHPGWPIEWGHATLVTPDLDIDYTRHGNNDRYQIRTSFEKKMNLILLLRARKTGIKSVTVNGKPARWKNVESVIGGPVIEIKADYQKQYFITVSWLGDFNKDILDEKKAKNGEHISFEFPGAVIQKIFDPQKILSGSKFIGGVLQSVINDNPGHHTAFVQVSQNGFTWWEPLNIMIADDLPEEKYPQRPIVSSQLQMINVDKFFNDKITQIFRNQYLSPRPKVPTLQLPTQGYGEWTHPLLTPGIDDKGLRSLAGEKNQISLASGLTFRTPSDTIKSNIIFTSQWDNYPKQVSIPLSGMASHAYFLMAGSTNPMQSRITNGQIIVGYSDGSSDTLLLKNPETWWPIEQDYYDDGYAFTTNAPRPTRIYLKTGKIINGNEYIIGNNKGKMIDGGAATVLDMPLDNRKTLKEIKLQTISNDVVIGLMSLTLQR